MSEKNKIEWSPEARERLNKLPAIIQTLVSNGVEGYALEKGINLITPELMQELKERVHGSEKPSIPTTPDSRLSEFSEQQARQAGEDFAR